MRGGNTAGARQSAQAHGDNPRKRGGIPFFKQPDFRFAPITPAVGGEYITTLIN